MKAQGQSKFKLERIRDLIIRHATPGATIDVVFLNKQASYMVRDTFVTKHATAKFQPPGCSLPCISGISTPGNVKVPLELQDLNQCPISFWDAAQLSISGAIQQMNAEPTPNEQSVASRLPQRRRDALVANLNSSN